MEDFLKMTAMTGKSDEAWIDKAAIQIANKGDNIAFWHNRVDFSAHEIKKIIEGCLREARQQESRSFSDETPDSTQSPTTRGD